MYLWLYFSAMSDFQINPFYEAIIDGLLKNKYFVSDQFFSAEEVTVLRSNLLKKYKEDAFKKSAIGNLSNEKIMDG